MWSGENRHTSVGDVGDRNVVTTVDSAFGPSVMRSQPSVEKCQGELYHGDVTVGDRDDVATRFGSDRDNCTVTLRLPDDGSSTTATPPAAGGRATATSSGTGDRNQIRTQLDRNDQATNSSRPLKTPPVSLSSDLSDLSHVYYTVRTYPVPRLQRAIRMDVLYHCQSYPHTPWAPPCTPPRAGANAPFPPCVDTVGMSTRPVAMVTHTFLLSFCTYNFAVICTRRRVASD